MPAKIEGGRGRKQCLPGCAFFGLKRGVPYVFTEIAMEGAGRTCWATGERYMTALSLAVGERELVNSNVENCTVRHICRPSLSYLHHDHLVL